MLDILFYSYNKSNLIKSEEELYYDINISVSFWYQYLMVDCCLFVHFYEQILSYLLEEDPEMTRVKAHINMA